jgi:hypothetical protein
MNKRIPHHWINWTEIVLDDPDLPFHSKALALFLSTYMNSSHDMAYPSVSTIRGRMGLGSNSTAIKYLGVLEDSGYLKTERRYGNSKIYTAIIPPNHPSITPPVVLHEMDNSITPRGLTVLHEVEPNKQENKQENKQVGKNSRFSRPSLDELKLFIKEKNLNLNAQEFINHYESNGWMVGKTKMKNWKAAAQQWSLREDKKNPRPKTNGSGKRLDALGRPIEESRTGSLL